ncbi:Hypothetical protein NTJ_07261 [Nesidiocoris tenuis]|uniref:Uncharacterized protein n=1 Tax=Nesidiocoris tenuis TaxID=355587 RepID=A0ABN7AQG3_9HEMI|nr:Hypothetical protein NTJ_07261 [Nesidiocoris tenuis]
MGQPPSHTLSYQPPDPPLSSTTRPFQSPVSIITESHGSPALTSLATSPPVALYVHRAIRAFGFSKRRTSPSPRGYIYKTEGRTRGEPRTASKQPFNRVRVQKERETVVPGKASEKEGRR